MVWCCMPAPVVIAQVTRYTTSGSMHAACLGAPPLLLPTAPDQKAWECKRPVTALRRYRGLVLPLHLCVATNLCCMMYVVHMCRGRGSLTAHMCSKHCHKQRHTCGRLRESRHDIMDQMHVACVRPKYVDYVGSTVGHFRSLPLAREANSAPCFRVQPTQNCHANHQQKQAWLQAVGKAVGQV